MQGLTPLQLALMSPKSNVQIIQVLLDNSADQTVLQPLTNNTIVHLAAKYWKGIDDIIKYIVKNT